MSVFKKLLFLVVVISFVQGQDDCANCPSGNGIACTGLNTYRFCFGGMIDTVEKSCEDDEICSTKTQKWCMPKGGPIQPSCSKGEAATDSCEICTENGKNDFACLGKNKFARCLGGKVSDVYQGNCPQGYICTTNSPNMCVHEILAQPTCSK